MPEKPTIPLPIMQPSQIELSSDARGDAIIKFEPAGEVGVLSLSLKQCS